MTAPVEQGYGPYSSEDGPDRPRRDVVSLSEYAAVLRRRWKAITACFLFGLLLAVPALLLSPKTYEAKALVALNPSQTTSSSGNTNRTDANTNTERGIAASTAVATRAREELAGKYKEYADSRPGQLVRKLTVTVPTGSQTLELRFRASSADKAADGVNAFARNYLALRSQQRSDANRTTIEGLRGIREQREAVVRDLNRQIAAEGTNAAQRASLSRQRDLVLQNVATLLAQEDAAGGAPVSAGTQVDVAVPPAGPTAPSPILYAAAGAILGLLAGLAYAFWREHRDDHVRGEAELARAGAAPVLANLKVPRRVPAGSGLAMLSAPESPEAAGYRLLAAKLQASTLPVGRTVMLTGPHGGDPRVGPNLAVALARSGRSVLLWASPHTLTSSFAPMGLSDAALPAAGVIGTVVALDALPGLSMLPLREDDLPAATATAAGASIDFVLVDDSTAPSAWRTLTLAGEADSVLVVSTVGRSGRRELRELLEQLRSIGAPLLGGVLLTGSRLPAPPAGVRGGALAPVRRPSPSSPAATVLPGSADPVTPDATPAAVLNQSSAAADGDSTDQTPPAGEAGTTDDTSARV